MGADGYYDLSTVSVSTSGFTTGTAKTSALSGESGTGSGLSFVYRPDGNPVNFSDFDLSRSASLRFAPNSNLLMFQGYSESSNEFRVGRIDPETGKTLWQHKGSLTNKFAVSTNTLIESESYGNGKVQAAYKNEDGTPAASDLTKLSNLSVQDNVFVDTATGNRYDDSTGKQLSPESTPDRSYDRAESDASGVYYVNADGSIHWKLTGETGTAVVGHGKGLIYRAADEQIAVIDSKGQESAVISTVGSGPLAGCQPVAITSATTAVLGACETGNVSGGRLIFIAI